MPLAWRGRGGRRIGMSADLDVRGSRNDIALPRAKLGPDPAEETSVMDANQPNNQEPYDMVAKVISQEGHCAAEHQGAMRSSSMG